MDTMNCPLTEPWPGCRRQHTEGSPAASAPWPTDLKHRYKQYEENCEEPVQLHYILFNTV